MPGIPLGSLVIPAALATVLESVQSPETSCECLSNLLGRYEKIVLQVGGYDATYPPARDFNDSNSLVATAKSRNKPSGIKSSPRVQHPSPNIGDWW